MNFHYFDLMQLTAIFLPAHKLTRMKLLFDSGRLGVLTPGAGIVCLIFALAAGGGCRKSPSTPPPVASPSPSDATSAAATPAGTPPPERMQPSVASTPAKTDPAQKSGPTQLQLLNRAMMGWEIKNHRHPRNFEEFASTGSIQIPAPPPGQKYAFNGKGFIILVNSTH